MTFEDSKSHDPQLVETLRGLEVVVTGDFRKARLDMARPELQNLLRRHGAVVVNDIRQSTDLLIRADSPNWQYGTYGQREAEFAEIARRGRRRILGVIDDEQLLRLLAGETVWARSPMSPPGKTPPVGRPYVIAAPASSSDEPILFERDPAAVETALAGHARTQNALADFVVTRGWAPLSPTGSAAQFDLAWNVGNVIWVAEVKSLTNQNEAVQLRLGLGQVLEYAWRLAAFHRRSVRPVLVPERRPSDAAWAEIAESYGVVLSWPDSFSSLDASSP